MTAQRKVNRASDKGTSVAAGDASGLSEPPNIDELGRNSNFSFKSSNFANNLKNKAKSIKDKQMEYAITSVPKPKTRKTWDVKQDLSNMQ